MKLVPSPTKIKKTTICDRLKLDFLVDEHAQKALFPSCYYNPILEKPMSTQISKNEKVGQNPSWD